MARIVLVTGGARSGKSRHAQKLAEAVEGTRAFVATCEPLDDEMRQRVQAHQRARREAGWRTVEEKVDLVRALRRCKQSAVILVDCLTLWVSNLLGEAGEDLTEEQIQRRCNELLAACAEQPGTVIFVTNEVGDGIVPDNALARRYRDLAGRCNQAMAAGADEVYLVVCGIAQRLK